MKTVVFFNNKGGVGKTSLVYHLAWMMQEMGEKVLAVDLDPQSNLTSAFLDEDELQSLWPSGPHSDTILGSLDLLIRSRGDILGIEPRRINDICLIPGDLGLSTFEDRLSEGWNKCTNDDPPIAEDGFTVMTAFYRVIIQTGTSVGATVALVDVGPNVGSLNRAALVAADYVVVPLGADLFSIQGLQNLGPTLHKWRTGWRARTQRDTVPRGLLVPDGIMEPIGYVLLSPSVRENRPAKAYRRWADRVPQTYARCVLQHEPTAEKIEDDPHMLANIKHFKSLMPMAQDARKPMFRLSPADGAIGGHASAVSASYAQFNALGRQILKRCHGLSDIESSKSC